MSTNPPPDSKAMPGHDSMLEFRRLLESLPAGAYTCNADGLITFYNARAIQVWGRTPKLNDPVDRFCGSFKLFSSDGTPLQHNACWMALALLNKKEYDGHEIIIEQPDGKRVTGLVHVKPLCDDSGELLGAVNVVVDISERKKFEEMLKKSVQDRNLFLATLAHELRTPLAAIRSSVEILQSPNETADALWCAQVIGRQVDQLTRLIGDLLDIARISNNKLTMRNEPTELASVIRDAIETVRPQIDAAGHTLTLALPSQPLIIEGDAHRLRQVITNLLSNAAKYTNQGGVIQLTARRDGNDAQITVRDNGIGITPSFLPHIFDAFTQIPSSIERSQGGLGIGLSLAKQLVDMHGGDITAHSDGPDTGSRFVIRLPICMGATTKIDATPPRPVASERPRPMRVLIVDDNRDAARSLGMLLQMAGHETRTVHDGPAAVIEAQVFNPQLVLLDIGLPGLSGDEVARAIRLEPWGRDITLIALTGWDLDEDQQFTRDAGFDHHLTKPVDPLALSQLMASLHPTFS